MTLVHYEQDAIKSPAQSLSFILRENLPIQKLLKIDVNKSQSNIPYVGFSLTIWFPVERQPPGHTKDFTANFLWLFCLFSLFLTVSSTSAVLGKLTSSDSAQRLL